MAVNKPVDGANMPDVLNVDEDMFEFRPDASARSEADEEEIPGVLGEIAWIEWQRNVPT